MTDEQPDLTAEQPEQPDLTDGQPDLTPKQADVTPEQADSTDEQADPQDEQPEPKPPAVVTSYTRRGDDDVLLGEWADVVAGEFKGRRGHYFEDVSYGVDGFPDRVFVRTRDADNIVIEVAYADLRPAQGYRGGR
jgi:hypothetical protein